MPSQQFMKLHKKILIIYICLLFILPLYSVKAFSQYYEGLELEEEITLISEDQQLIATIPAETFNNNLSVYLLENNNSKLPENVKLISNVYQLWLVSDSNINPQYTIKLYFTEGANEFTAKDIYIWQTQNIWKKIESTVNIEENYVEANINNPAIKLAVFETLEKTAFNNEASLSSADDSLEIIPPTSWQESNFTVVFKNYDHLNYPLNEHYERISDIYEYDIKSNSDLKIEKPVNLNIRYQTQNQLHKELFYWDNNHQNWIKLPSVNNIDEQYLNTKVHFKYLRLAIFERQGAQEGIASWYSYKDCPCAASRDYPKGTTLKVTNITEGSDNYNKSVIVTINDYGPEEWTKRIIDLDKTAFQQIGNTKSGIMNVIIEQIND